MSICYCQENFQVGDCLVVLVIQGTGRSGVLQASVPCSVCATVSCSVFAFRLVGGLAVELCAAFGCACSRQGKRV
jgi:hypothetical protein